MKKSKIIFIIIALSMISFLFYCTDNVDKLIYNNNQINIDYKLESFITVLDSTIGIEIPSLGIEEKGIMLMTLEAYPIDNVSDDDSFNASVVITDGTRDKLANGHYIYEPDYIRLIYVWNGLNKTGLKVDPGVYTANIEISYYFKKTLAKKEIVRKNVIVRN